jgi:flagellar biogenesis protein FliO
LIGYGCLLIWGVWWLGKRLGKWPSLQKLVQAQGSLRVIESRALGFRSQLHLVACGEQRFLVASSPTGVHLISEVADPRSSPPDPGFEAVYDRAASSGRLP